MVPPAQDLDGTAVALEFQAQVMLIHVIGTENIIVFLDGRTVLAEGEFDLVITGRLRIQGGVTDEFVAVFFHQAEAFGHHRIPVHPDAGEHGGGQSEVVAAGIQPNIAGEHRCLGLVHGRGPQLCVSEKVGEGDVSVRSRHHIEEVGGNGHGRLSVPQEGDQIVDHQTPFPGGQAHRESHKIGEFLGGGCAEEEFGPHEVQGDKVKVHMVALHPVQNGPGIVHVKGELGRPPSGEIDLRYPGRGIGPSRHPGGDGEAPAGLGYLVGHGFPEVFDMGGGLKADLFKSGAVGVFAQNPAVPGGDFVVDTFCVPAEQGPPVGEIVADSLLDEKIPAGEQGGPQGIMGNVQLDAVHRVVGILVDVKGGVFPFNDVAVGAFPAFVVGPGAGLDQGVVPLAAVEVSVVGIAGAAFEDIVAPVAVEAVKAAGAGARGAPAGDEVVQAVAVEGVHPVVPHEVGEVGEVEGVVLGGPVHQIGVVPARAVAGGAEAHVGHARAPHQYVGGGAPGVEIRRGPALEIDPFDVLVPHGVEKGVLAVEAGEILPVQGDHVPVGGPQLEVLVLAAGQEILNGAVPGPIGGHRGGAGRGTDAQIPGRLAGGSDGPRCVFVLIESNGVICRLDAQFQVFQGDFSQGQGVEHGIGRGVPVVDDKLAVFLDHIGVGAGAPEHGGMAPAHDEGVVAPVARKIVVVDREGGPHVGQLLAAFHLGLHGPGIVAMGPVGGMVLEIGHEGGQKDIVPVVAGVIAEQGLVVGGHARNHGFRVHGDGPEKMGRGLGDLNIIGLTESQDKIVGVPRQHAPPGHGVGV